MSTALTETQVRRRGPFGRLLTAHPWVGDVAVALGILLIGSVTCGLALSTVEGATALGLFPRDSPTVWTVPVTWFVGAVLGAGLLMFRRAWPLGVTLVLTVLSVLSLLAAGVVGVLGLCLACAMFSLTTTRPPATAWLVATAAFVTVTAVSWWWQDVGISEILLWRDQAPLLADGTYEPYFSLPQPDFSVGRRLLSAALLLVLLLLAMAFGSAARARRLHDQDLVARYEAMARERDQSAALARAAERTRIAREMHDVVAHSVSVMVALSDGAGAALDRAPDRSREALHELSRTGRDALSDMQRVLGALDPAEDVDDTTPADRPLEPAQTDLATVVERFRTAGVPVTATGLDAPLPPDTSLRLAVGRIVTEGLTNVLRHAPGTTLAEVALRSGPSAVEVEILDAGGTRPGTGGGSGRGVLGMRERAGFFGGRVDAGPRPGGGWRVHVVLPYAAGDDGEGGRA